MKAVVISASLALVLSAAPVFAQAAPAGRGAQPAAPRPAAPAPAPAAAAPATPPPAPVPFPAGAKIAYVNLQLIANQSAEGKSLTAKVQALMAKKQQDAATKQKQLADAQNKLQTSSALMSEAARGALEKDIERMNVEGQRFQQDAQAEINELSRSLQNEFQQKLFPILNDIVRDHDRLLLTPPTPSSRQRRHRPTTQAITKLDERRSRAAAGDARCARNGEVGRAGHQRPSPARSDLLPLSSQLVDRSSTGPGRLVGVRRHLNEEFFRTFPGTRSCRRAHRIAVAAGGPAAAAPRGQQA
jgi:Skp family chaperone for outer membrane proteins